MSAGPGAGGSAAPSRSPGHAPAPRGAPPASAGSRGLADPPTAAPAPVLPGSSLRGGFRDSLFLPGVAAGGGTGRAPAALASAPASPSTTPPAPPGRTPPSARPLTGRGRTREGELGGGRGREGPGSLCLPPQFSALSQNPGVKVNFLPRSPFPGGRKRKGKEGHSGEGEAACSQGPGLALPPSLPPPPGLPGEPGPVPLPLSRKGLSEGSVGSPGGRGPRKLWAGNRAGGRAGGLETVPAPPPRRPLPPGSFPPQSLGTARSWQAAQTLLKPPRLEGPPRPSFQTCVVYESPF